MRKSPRNVLTIAAVAGLAVAAPAQAQTGIRDRDPGPLDVAKTPMRDLNLSKDEIPTELLLARVEPYNSAGMDQCAAITTAVERLNDILGPDIDVPQEEGERITPGRAARAIVSHLIPFRGVIREVSGANEHDRQVRDAIEAGLARRGFLKGLGQAKGCAYPARPATRQDAATPGGDAPVIEAENVAQGDAAPAPTGKVRFESRPVVQLPD